MIEKKVLIAAWIVALLFLCPVASKGGAKENYKFKTTVGHLKTFGQSPQTVFYFVTEEGVKYRLEGNLVSELVKLRQFELVITGKLEDATLIPLNYDVKFDKKTDQAEQGLVLGKLYQANDKLFLLTKDQFVIEVKDDLMEELIGHKVLLRGNYRYVAPYKGEMEVNSFIDLEAE